MDARVAWFRRAVEKYFGGRPGRGARYPKDLQHEAMPVARTGMLGGQSLGLMAREMGVGRMTLAGWLEQVGEVDQPLRPVEIQRDSARGRQRTSSLKADGLLPVRQLGDGSMKKPVLALLALLFLLSFTQSMTQTLPVGSPAAASAPDATAEFLATLSDGQPQISDDQVPAPLFMTGCNSQCTTGEICCYLCGNPPEGDDSGCWGCVTPVKGGCPQVY